MNEDEDIFGTIPIPVTEYDQLIKDSRIMAFLREVDSATVKEIETYLKVIDDN